MTPAVLLMSFGTPENVQEMGAFLEKVLAPRSPSTTVIEEMKRRYTEIGGRSPLTEITFRQAEALQKQLDGIPVRVGMRCWKPFIHEVVDLLQGAPLVGLPLAPHYTRHSTPRYHDALRDAAPNRQIVLVDRFGNHPKLIDAWVDRIRAKAESSHKVLFTAHSVPETPDDPYAHEVRETCELISKRLPGLDWALAWQSRSPGAPGTWLAPDAADALKTIGSKRVLVAPIGFVSDHAEVLYDVDIDLAAQATKLGIELTRVDMLNDHPLFIEALADVVRKAL